MSAVRPDIRVRHAVLGDAEPLCETLNGIIGIGGTTALEVPLPVAEFSGYFLEGERFISCHVAEDRLTWWCESRIFMGRHWLIGFASNW